MLRINADDLLRGVAVEEAGEIALKGIRDDTRSLCPRDFPNGHGRLGYSRFRHQPLDQLPNLSSPDGHCSPSPVI